MNPESVRRWIPVAVFVVGMLLLMWLSVVVGQSVSREPTGDGETLADPAGTYDPTEAGEETPDRYRQVLGRDCIAPIYNPSFVAADAIDWADDTLVIGVADGEEAKAYSVTFLNRREMVIDEINGSPILVSW